MFEIQLGPSGEIVMAGRLDATQCDAALRFLEGLAQPRVIHLPRPESTPNPGPPVLPPTPKPDQATRRGPLPQAPHHPWLTVLFPQYRSARKRLAGPRGSS